MATITPLKTHTRILCPECYGNQLKIYPVDKDEREEQPCETCGGTGIMEEIKTIEYRKI